MNFFADPIIALMWTTRILSIGILIDSFEQIYCWREFRDKGIFDWQWLRQSPIFTKRRFVNMDLLDLLFDLPVWFFLLLLRGIAVLVLIFFPIQTWSSIIGLTIVFIITSFINFRSAPYGTETSNRLTLVITGALLLRCAAPNSLILMKASLWFIALQTCISYLTAGVGKFFNQGWRNGYGLFNVVNNQMNGLPPQLAMFFYQHQTIGKIFTWFTIGIECTFPLVLLFGQPFVFLFLVWGMLFHLANAILLGLNKFFWVWLATYPAILFVTQR